MKERAPSRYKCMDNGTCEITVATRNACRYCRFQRCIQVGMSVEGKWMACEDERGCTRLHRAGSRIGRQSNLFKHHMRKRLVLQQGNLHTLSVRFQGMMLQRNGQIPSRTMLHQMVHSTTTAPPPSSNRRRHVSDSMSSDCEGETLS